MKLTVSSLLASVEKKLSRKRSRSQSRSISRSDTGASSSSSSLSDDSLHRAPTPRSVFASSPKITRSELEAVLRRLGPDPPSDEEISLILDEADACTADVDDLHDAFKVFDTDGDGRISAQELLNVLLSLGEQACSLDECREMIGSVDSDGDGFVCFRDFTRMMAGQSC